MLGMLTRILVLGLLLVGVWNVGGDLNRRAALRRTRPTVSVYYKINPHLLNLLSLGHKRLIDHIAVIEAIQFFADKDSPKNIPFDAMNDGVIKGVLALRPQHESFYMFACFVSAFVYHHEEACENISQVGLEALPEAWRIAATQGFIEKFVRKDDAKAAVYYQLASSKKSAPPYMAALAAKLAAKDPNLFSDPDFAKSISDLPDGDKLLESLRASGMGQKKGGQL